ncbi:HD-GYP domain-containing protein [Cohnella rhizosphaerae]|uniref:HD-GYP domain-containing protein n=1 Tax=Cohnella rhizosphaerae TaxID=1457232 RepID=A0A9X4KV88_9BACL|nr:HD-GYP domain-containing protein [Cohnella rhizosphaerae]MDG0811505.1 HD-GYP domain-containing protein [Cohnella rhizosphaerae]
MRHAELLGKKVKHDIVHNGLVLVPAGVALEKSHIELLENYRVDPEEVRVAEQGGRPQDAESVALMTQAVQFAKEMFERVREAGHVDPQEIEHTLTPMVLQMSENKDMFSLFHTVKAKDEYTHQHNIGVSVLSTLIGRWLGWRDDQVALLSLAASLHDVGKVRIPDEILLKPGRLTADEYAEMKLHTVYGYEILKANPKIDPRVALVALQHHERNDGRGYPYGICNSEMDAMSRVVAVADIFHAMSSRRPYHEPMPFYRVVSEMRNGSFGGAGSAYRRRVPRADRPALAGPPGQAERRTLGRGGLSRSAGGYAPAREGRRQLHRSQAGAESEYRGDHHLSL